MYVRNTLIPKQPFMVSLSSSYYKYVVNAYGISHFYSFKAEKGTTLIDTSVPDACIDIIFHYDAEGKEVGADWYGTDLMPHPMKCYEGCTHFGVRFLPGLLPLLADASMPEIIDNIIPYDSIGRCCSLPMWIAECATFKEQIDMFMSVYLEYYKRNESASASLKNYIVSEVVQSYGNIRVAELSEKTGYSISYIDKIFFREIGIPPKRFCGMIRFQWMLNWFASHVGERNTVDYAGIINELGYYDQSHMIKEFKRYSQRTPQNYFSELDMMDYLHRLKILENNDLS